MAATDIEVFLPMLEWITIPPGKVTLEKHGTFEVASFTIGKYPVTNAQYDVFVADGGYQYNVWWRGLVKPSEQPAKSHSTVQIHPRAGVTWYEALAFCRWLSSKLGQDVTLPTEMQWQRAAQGDDGRVYPWGSEFDKARCNASESAIQQTTPVDRFPQGKSPFGVFDMAGNLWEWCLNHYNDPSQVGITGSQARTVRGGSWASLQFNVRCAYRTGFIPHLRGNFFGFRVVGIVPA